MRDILNLKQHDLQPYYYFKVEDAYNEAVDLTGATIVCTMKNRSTGVLKINRQSAGIALADQDTDTGKAQYQWQSGDTDTVGNYIIEFEITPASGGKFTVPPDDTDDPAYVDINASQDTV